nr:unnamed protein product [Callosobruchus chinensis]
MQNILQWNCNGCISHLNELRIMTREYDPFCVSLQETHFKPHSSFSLRGYNIFRKDVAPNLRARGGVAILLKNNIGAKEFVIDTNLQVVAVEIEAPLKVTLCNIYLPDNNWNISQLRSVVESLPRPYIIMGDFNAHSPLWGDQPRDQRGRAIKFLIETSEITLLNTGEGTHFNVHSGSTSAIDLTFSSPRLAANLSWKVLDDLNFSDHFPIQILTNIEKRFYPSHQRWLTRKANWENYVEAFNIPSLPEDPIEALNALTNSIQTAASESIPQSSSSISNKSLPWWNEEIKESIQKKKSALNIFRRYPTTSNMITFKKLRAKSRKLINEAQKKSWQEYVSSITSEVPIREVWKKIKIISGNNYTRPTNILKIDGQLIEGTNEVCDALANQFETASSTNNYSITFQQIKATEENDLTIFSTSSLEESCSHLQSEINKLNSLAESRGFRMSPTKTAGMHFCRLRTPHSEPNLTLQGQDISFKDSVKLLGITLDPKLHWKQHIDALTNRCRKILNLIRCMSNTRWGADRDVLILMYKTLIESRISYACTVYGSVRKSKLQELEKIQLMALRAATGAFRTSPTVSVLCDTSGIEYLSNRINLGIFHLIRDSIIRRVNECTMS